jgi:hypothetical protein
MPRGPISNGRAGRGKRTGLGCPLPQQGTRDDRSGRAAAPGGRDGLVSADADQGCANHGQQPDRPSPNHLNTSSSCT